MRKALLVSLILSLGLSACSREKSRTNEDRLVSAYKLIDADREDEAAIILEEEIAKHKPGTPAHAKLTVVLASAYAHKAGLRAQRFAKVLGIGPVKVKLDRALSLSNDPNLSKTEAVDELLGAVAEMMGGIAQMSRVYVEAIPSVKTKDTKFLLYSVRLLDSIDDNAISPGDAVYRSVIRVTYLKHFLSEDLTETNLRPDFSELSCTVDFEEMADMVKHVSELAIGILKDFAKARPSRAKEYAEQQIKVAEASARLTNVMTSVSLLDEALNRFTKQAVVQTGLQKILKCTPKSEVTSTGSSSAASASSVVN